MRASVLGQAKVEGFGQMLERFALFEHLLIDLAGGIGAALDLLRSNLDVEVQEVVVERLAEVGAELR